MMGLDHTTNGQGPWRRLCSRVTDFARNEAGTVTVESVIILPIILFGLQATYAYFESYRHQSMALKANYAVADYLSRIPSYDQTMLDGLDELFEYMTRSSESSWVRVTVVECREDVAKCNDETPRKLHIQNDATLANSHTTDGKNAYSREAMRNKLAHHIPKMYKGEFLIVVETYAQFRPTFAGRWTGIYRPEFAHVTVTSPREFDFLCWKEVASDCPTS